MPHKQIFTAKNGQTKNLDKAFRAAYDAIKLKLFDRWKSYQIEVKTMSHAKRYRAYFGYVVRPIFESGILQAAMVTDDDVFTLTPEMVHDALKQKYAAKEVVITATGETIRTNFSTRPRSDEEFYTFVEKVKADFSSYGVVFPELPTLDEMAADDTEFYMMINA